jgi:hypothetical protein
MAANAGTDLAVPSILNLAQAAHFSETLAEDERTLIKSCSSSARVPIGVKTTTEVIKIRVKWFAFMRAPLRLDGINGFLALVQYRHGARGV